jgi:hypothetical protein
VNILDVMTCSSPQDHGSACIWFTADEHAQNETFLIGSTSSGPSAMGVSGHETARRSAVYGRKMF